MYGWLLRSYSPFGVNRKWNTICIQGELQLMIIIKRTVYYHKWNRLNIKIQAETVNLKDISVFFLNFVVFWFNWFFLWLNSFIDFLKDILH